MKKEKKQQTKPVNIKPVQKQDEKGQKKLILFFSFLFLLALFVSFLVPVYYVPLFKNISSRYGLSSDIARQLTLLDLALSSLGIETPKMASAFQKYEIEYEPDIFYTSRFDAEGKNRLINARETYYHEYERTRKRPAEIAGIYKDDTAVSVPEIDGNVSGVRALPKSDFLDLDDDFDTKASSTTANKDGRLDSRRRQVRSSFDRKIMWQDQATGGQGANTNKPEPLPDFASSIYVRNTQNEIQTLENSRMVKPVNKDVPFTVVKPQGTIAKLVGNIGLTEAFSASTSFGTYDGALGYYIKDDLPKFTNLYNFLGNSGKDMFSSYFYSNSAVNRQFDESSKHLSEIAFHADERQNEILIAKEQKKRKAVQVSPTGSPLVLMLTVKKNLRACDAARESYQLAVRPLLQQYHEAKKELRKISTDNTNVAKKGAPGDCRGPMQGLEFLAETQIFYKTYWLREGAEGNWNGWVDKLKDLCYEIDQEAEKYTNACRMVYKRDNSKDTCESILALKLKGDENNLPDCHLHVVWEYPKPEKSPTFDGCDSREDCAQKQDALFAEIDNNIEVLTKPGYVVK